MINFESQYFRKMSFEKAQIEQFLNSALHDFKIAQSYDGGFFVAEKDSREYLQFVNSVFKKVKV